VSDKSCRKADKLGEEHEADIPVFVDPDIGGLVGWRCSCGKLRVLLVPDVDGKVAFVRKSIADAKVWIEQLRDMFESSVGPSGRSK
jgi:hypothetical protein